ncbi:MAG: carbohydrate kinase family protein [Candidatus Altiarchaeia archaeon]
MTDITSIGDVNIDILTSNIADYPPKDTQIILEDLHLTSGGCAANYAKASAVLGSKTRLIARIGDDLFGNLVRKSLGAIDDLDLCLISGGRTAVTLAITFKDKTRSFLTFPGANSELSVKDIDYDLIEGRYLHVASFFLQGLRADTKKLLDHAHKKGMTASFDTGFDPLGWSRADVALVRKTLKDVDIFFPNLAEAQAVTKAKNQKDIIDELLSLGPSIVALKLGSKGAWIASEKEKTFIPAFRVKAIDTTGAGDVFAAGFIRAHSLGWDLKKCGLFASAAAALKTQGYGAERYPTNQEVNAFLTVNSKFNFRI